MTGDPESQTSSGPNIARSEPATRSKAVRKCDYNRPMRQIRYSVAMSLDGYIAGPNGEVDWITPNPEIDFGAMMSEFDTLVTGRGTYSVMKAAGNVTMPGIRTVVVSRTLRQHEHPDVTI